jgi:hypothetical protein
MATTGTGRREGRASDTPRPSTPETRATDATAATMLDILHSSKQLRLSWLG